MPKTPQSGGLLSKDGMGVAVGAHRSVSGVLDMLLDVSAAPPVSTGDKLVIVAQTSHRTEG